MPELSVVVPVHCEETNLPRFLDVITEVMDSISNDYELVFVDDGSDDSTWAVLQAAAQRCPHLKALRLSRNFGKESALCAGLDYATGKAVILIDVDFEHPPELIPEMVALWRGGEVDIVEALKTSRGQEGWVTRWGSRAFYFFLRLLSGFDLKNHTDFKLIDRRVIAAWSKLGERNLFFRGMVRWLGFRRQVVHFEVTSAERRSRWSHLELVRLATTGLTSFSSLPLQLISLFGFLLSIPAAALLAHTIWMKLSGRALDGFATVISLQLIIGSSLMMGMGLLGTYVARIHDEVKGRPRYLVSEYRGLPATSSGASQS